jgi:hypothetical protein
MSLKAPPSYSGERNVNFRTWLQEVERFLRTEEECFVSEVHKINYVGSLMTGKATQWFQERERQLAADQLNDNWRAFKSKMQS